MGGLFKGTASDPMAQQGMGTQTLGALAAGAKDPALQDSLKDKPAAGVPAPAITPTPYVPPPPMMQNPFMDPNSQFYGG